MIGRTMNPRSRILRWLALCGGLACAAALASAAGTPEAAPEPDPVAAAINERLGRGINLGNTLEAPHEGLWGVTLHEDDFAAIAQAGFRSVRVPIRWSAHTATRPPYEVSEAIFRRVEWVLEQALEAGLAAMVNVHHYDEIFRDPAGHEERLVAIWEQVASRLRDQPPEVVFELLNEPHDALDAERWNALHPRLLAAVRASNPERVVVLGPDRWNAIGQLRHLQLPAGDRRLIVSVHYYEPFRFTHQGASWVGPRSQEWLGTEWHDTPEARREIERAFAAAAEWGRRHGVPINLGEFGAYSRADLASRVRWTRAVRDAAEAHGFSWHYWEFASGFGAWDPRTRMWRPELRAALVGE